MSAMANTTPIVTTVTKTTTKEKTPKETGATPRVNTYSSYRTGALHGSHSRDSDRSYGTKRGRGNESPLSHVSESDT
ncbi:hypothetical protein Tco_0160075, partial [Tanacetum coccineum]